jgi:hypothetical protein
MNAASRRRRIVQRASAVLAGLFGVATIVAGTRTLAGWSDPGYEILRPLLIFNTAMGAVYLAAGVAMWRKLRWGTYAAATIFVVNLSVLAAIVLVYMSDGGVAIESIGAMGLRSAVWLGLWAALAWILARTHARSDLHGRGH